MFTLFRTRQTFTIGAGSVGLLLIGLSWLNGQTALAADADAPTAREMSLMDARLSRIEAKQDNQLVAIFGAALAGGGISGHFAGRRHNKGTPDEQVH